MRYLFLANSANKKGEREDENQEGEREIFTANGGNIHVNKMKKDTQKSLVYSKIM